MACVALASLIATIELEFQQPNQRVFLHDYALIKSLYANLFHLQAFLDEANDDDAAIRIRDFALEAEDQIEIQLRKFLLARNKESRKRAFKELHKTLQKEAENSEKLLEIIDKTRHEAAAEAKEEEETAENVGDDFVTLSHSCEETNDKSEREMALTSLITKAKLQIQQSIQKVCCEYKSAAMFLCRILCYLQDFVEQSIAANKDLETQIRCFTLKAEELGNFLQAKSEHKEEASQQLHQALQEATENAVELLKIMDPQSKSNVADGSSEHSPKPENKEIVGRKNEFEWIRNKLLYRTGNLRLISIYGMTGIGKTALVEKVYKDKRVESSFDARHWITMPQESNVSQMLWKLVQSISPEKAKKMKRGSTPHDELAKEVSTCLKGKKYLIVLDNLWSNQARNDIRTCFPNEKNGSRILLTTTHFNPDYNTILDSAYEITFQDVDECWVVFCSVLPPNMAFKLEDLKSPIVETCGRLPRTIVAVAKRLSKCDDDPQQEWKKIKKELESMGSIDRSKVALYYNQLPQHLKVVYLYLGAFPKHYEIPVKTLLRLLSSEGVLSQRELQYEAAYGCLKELVDRSLVLKGKVSSDGKIKTCKMHSVMHSFCVGEAQKEGILCVVNTHQHPGLSVNKFSKSGRWLSLCPHSFDYYGLFSTNNPRSILIFHENPKMSSPFKLLRVLAFVSSPFLQNMCEHLGDLVFLRYLHVTEWFESLNQMLSTNLNMQTVVISSDESQNGVPTLLSPSKIWESPKLRHLEVGNMYVVDPPSVYKENLETLSWVSPTLCGKEVDYNRFPNLRKLKVLYKDDTIMDNLSYLEGLEKLTVLVSAGYTVTLSKQCMFPRRLKKLKLSGANLSESNLMVIGKLPMLQVLKLENAFYGKVWEVAEGEFNSLRFLLLKAEKLEKLVAKEQSFPHLTILVLRCCCCLETIPSRFYTDFFSQRSMQLEQCSPSVIAYAKKIHQGLRSLQKRMFEIKINGHRYTEESSA